MDTEHKICLKYLTNKRNQRHVRRSHQFKEDKIEVLEKKNIIIEIKNSKYQVNETKEKVSK